jgi:hypothetical protein
MNPGKYRRRRRGTILPEWLFPTRAVRWKFLQKPENHPSVRPICAFATIKDGLIKDGGQAPQERKRLRKKDGSPGKTGGKHSSGVQGPQFRHSECQGQDYSGPELVYPEGTPFKSTRPSGSGDPAQYSTGHSHSGSALNQFRRANPAQNLARDGSCFPLPHRAIRLLSKESQEYEAHGSFAIDSCLFPSPRRCALPAVFRGRRWRTCSSPADGAEIGCFLFGCLG